MKKIEQKIIFKASCHKVYEMLMDSEKHAEFTGEEAEISREVGGKIKAYGDYVEGENLELIEDKKIVQKWRSSDFPEGQYSKAIFELKDVDGKCELNFTQEDVPDEEYEGLKDGWDDFYWNPMKELLEGEHE